MKKAILSLAIAALAFSSLPAFAQAPGNNDGKSCKNPTECAQARKGGPEKGPKASNPFEGIELTDAQKSSLEALRTKRAEACKAARAEKQKSDSARMATRQADRKAKARARLDEVKAILTPEQYVVYLENIVIDQPAPRHGQGDKARRDNGKKGGKDGRKDGQRRGPRPEGQAPQAPQAPQAR